MNVIVIVYSLVKLNENVAAAFDDEQDQRKVKEEEKEDEEEELAEEDAMNKSILLSMSIPEEYINVDVLLA
jgi:hypothetical protein